MRKIPSNYENPLDNILLHMSEFICPFFKSLGFNPNGITTISLIFGLLAIWSLWKGHIWYFSILYFISYFFDCVDGHFARKYNKVTKLGDLYDHVKDAVIAILLIVVVYIRNRNRCSIQIWIPVFVIFIIFTILGFTHLGCQEKIYDTDESRTLNIGKQLCSSDPEQKIKWTRFFGMGTWVVVMISCVIILEKSRLCD
jgi:phosphatidylglycerophosphate synthase